MTEGELWEMEQETEKARISAGNVEFHIRVCVHRLYVEIRRLRAELTERETDVAALLKELRARDKV